MYDKMLVLDANDIFDTVQNDVSPLLETIQKMIAQLKMDN
jgi:uncharacterized protein with HEPN domain